MKEILKKLSLTLATMLMTSLAANAAHNPDFIRKMKNPKTYVADKFFLTESICGKNQLQHVADYDGSRGQPVEFVLKNEQAVGALAYGTPEASRKYCTGTLISENLFLTAAHCIDSSITKEFAVFNYQKAQGVPDLLPQDHVKILEVVEEALGGLDYAILKLEGQPVLKYGFRPINVKEIELGHLLTIIQHPSGNPKMVDVGTRNGTRSEVYMTYGDLDTLPGSSGSGILDSTAFVAGVHTNGGCSASGGANAGVMMTEIFKHSPVVQQMAQ